MNNCMLPKSPEGAIGILYGKRGDHKTNVILSMLAASSAQRILFSAGEGAYGVERERIAARPSLAGRVKILPRVPLFRSPKQVAAFIQGSESIGFKPEIVVLDTLATTLVGLDENGAEAAQMLTDNGACGIIKRAWNCTVILIAHAGKDPTRGVRGSSGFEGNVDFVIVCEADKRARAIKLTCTKMRDGRDGHSTYWTYDEVGVPVPMQITEAEYLKIVMAGAEQEKKNPIGMVVLSWLRLNGHHEWRTGVETPELATGLTEDEIGFKPIDVEEQAAWETKRQQWIRALNAGKSKAWGKTCTGEEVLPGGTKMILRWYSAPPESVEF